MPDTQPRKVSAGQVLSDIAPGPSSAALEAAYERIGDWRGPYATPAGTRAEVAFWQKSGRAGFSWLAGRLRTETDTQVLVSAADVLSEVGLAAVAPVVDALESEPAPGQAFSLLRALGAVPRPPIEFQERLARALSGFLSHPDVDVREAAVGATRALADREAIVLLERALTGEGDEAIVAALREEIDERGER